MDQYQDTVGFAMSTWRKVKEFQAGLRALETRLPMHEVRDYLVSGRRDASVPADIYDEIDRLRELRAEGIRQEMKYAEAQAKACGLTLPDEILQGYHRMALPPSDLLKQAPSLGIYRHFMWLGTKEAIL
ncbi:hypothetical protein [Xylanibacter rodentium]|uniref:hypothetical protein n=1 Tax=Xylanibacter rodentium TaxID=2736289 RepID=UPI00259C696B|nr:hypothetical protein [Xylanibacter rodentium]